MQQVSRKSLHYFAQPKGPTTVVLFHRLGYYLSPYVLFIEMLRRMSQIRYKVRSSQGNHELHSQDAQETLFPPFQQPIPANTNVSVKFWVPHHGTLILALHTPGRQLSSPLHRFSRIDAGTGRKQTVKKVLHLTPAPAFHSRTSLA